MQVKVGKMQANFKPIRFNEKAAPEFHLTLLFFDFL